MESAYALLKKSADAVVMKSSDATLKVKDASVLAPSMQVERQSVSLATCRRHVFSEARTHWSLSSYSERRHYIDDDGK